MLALDGMHSTLICTLSKVPAQKNTLCSRRSTNCFPPPHACPPCPPFHFVRRAAFSQFIKKIKKIKKYTEYSWKKMKLQFPWRRQRTNFLLQGRFYIMGSQQRIIPGIDSANSPVSRQRWAGRMQQQSCPWELPVCETWRQTQKPSSTLSAEGQGLWPNTGMGFPPSLSHPTCLSSSRYFLRKWAPGARTFS